MKGLAWIGVSLGAHVAVAALLFAPKAAPRAQADPAPRLAGETFELPAPALADVPLANASPSPDSVSTSAPAEEGDAPARPTPPPRAAAAARPSHAGRPSAGRAEPQDGEGGPGTSSAAALYGAVGDRSAAELTAVFTRAFPQAASADPLWKSAALGSAGSATVVVTLGESGNVEDAQVLGAPSAALASAVRRTLSLIKGRPFVAKGRVTKIEVSATVTPDSVHDGLHGDVFAIGSSVDGNASAFFALAMGRRIDARFRVAK